MPSSVYPDLTQPKYTQTWSKILDFYKSSLRMDTACIEMFMDTNLFLDNSSNHGGLSLFWLCNPFSFISILFLFGHLKILEVAMKDEFCYSTDLKYIEYWRHRVSPFEQHNRRRTIICHVNHTEQLNADAPFGLKLWYVLKCSMPYRSDIKTHKHALCDELFLQCLCIHKVRFTFEWKKIRKKMYLMINLHHESI